MDNNYGENKLSLFENIYLCMKGRKDGKKGVFEEKDDIYISPFMKNEMSIFNRFCLKVKEQYMEEVEQNIQIAKTEVDEMDFNYTDYVRKYAQIEHRKKMLDGKFDYQEEMIDLEARNEQLNITEKARINQHRKIVREKISVLELLLNDYDDKISKEKAHYYQRQLKYLEYAGKYFANLNLDFNGIENVCAICGMKEPFEKERNLINQFKTAIEYDIDRTND